MDLRRAALLALLAAAALLAGCGDSAQRAERPGRAAPPARKPASPPRRESDARVIRRWSDTLRAGDLVGAARLFGLPVTVENGEPARRLTSPADVLAFNASLPCGARLLDTRRKGRYTVATFRLTERPGGACGAGVGDTAATAFRLRAGKIVEWLRVPSPSEPAPVAPGSSTA